MHGSWISQKQGYSDFDKMTLKGQTKIHEEIASLIMTTIFILPKTKLVQTFCQHITSTMYYYTSILEQYYTSTIMAY